MRRFFPLSLVLSAVLLLPASCRDAPRGDETGGAKAVPAGSRSSSLEEAVASITAEEMADRIGILAHDSMGGRDTPSSGLEMAATWAAAEFERMRLEPGGDDGGFIQRYSFTPRGGGATSPVMVPNVVGLLQGSDPELQDEWVVFSAHFDHVSGPPDASGDSIYNGADDNASGTAAVMEIAQAFATLAEKPARSLAFVLVSGEEKGLLGARHFARGASIPPEAQVADINADMLSMNWPDSIFVFGGEYSTMGSTLDQVLASRSGLGVAIMENRWPQMPLFRMSDHFAFVQEGTPGIFFFSGLHENLHQPGDEPDAVDPAKAARVARLMFHLGLEVAQAPEPPEWTDAGREMLADLEEGRR
jgi:hypothetical protein